MNQPILGAQAFPDHLQLVAGEFGKKVHQLDLPVLDEERARFVRQLRNRGIEAPDRRPVGENMALAFTIVPGLFLLAWVAFRLVVWIALGGILAGLRSLDAEVGISSFLALALVGAFVLVIRFRKLRIAPRS